MEPGMAENNQLIRTIFGIVVLTVLANGLLTPSCDTDMLNPQVDDVITLTCKLATNDSLENITLTWFHDGKHISLDQQTGVVRTKLSDADYGINFTCEVREAGMETQICLVVPLKSRPTTPGLTSTAVGARAAAAAVAGTITTLVPKSQTFTTPFFTSTFISTSAFDDKPADPRQRIILIIFIAIIIAGGVPILVLVICCIAWISRKTISDHRSYTLNDIRPRSDSFDDSDPEAVADERPAAPLPGEMKAIKAMSSSVKNGTPPVLKSLVQKEPHEKLYSDPFPGSESVYQNTGMGHGEVSTLPLYSNSKNVYLVPRSTPASSQEDLTTNNAKIYENTGFGSKQDRFAADQSATLPNFKL